MGTLKQNAANAANSAKSTGPVTADGKRIVSRNALKWGVFSKMALLPDEDEGLFRKFAHQLLEALQPMGALETALADGIVACLWRWRRLHGIEAGLFTMYRQYEGADRGLATAFAHDASQMDSLGRLSRYETGLERRFLRLLHELERLQARRLGDEVRAPAVVDLDIRSDFEGEVDGSNGHAERKRRDVYVEAVAG